MSDHYIHIAYFIPVYLFLATLFIYLNNSSNYFNQNTINNFIVYRNDLNVHPDVWWFERYKMKNHQLIKEDSNQCENLLYNGYWDINSFKIVGIDFDKIEFGRNLSHYSSSKNHTIINHPFGANASEYKPKDLHYFGKWYRLVCER